MTRVRKGKEDKGEKSPTKTVGESTMDDEVLRQRIAEKAYELYQKRGESHGHDVDDWLEAARLVLREIKGKARGRAKQPRRKGR